MSAPLEVAVFVEDTQKQSCSVSVQSRLSLAAFIMPDWRILQTSFHSTSYEEFPQNCYNKSPGFGKKVSIPNMVGNADRFLDCFGFSVGCSHSSRLLKFMASGRGLVPVQEKPGNQDEVNRVKRRLGEPQGEPIWQLDAAWLRL